jgi:hypothetical protein
VAAKPSSGSARHRRLLRGGLIGLALLVGVVTWVATRGDSEESTPEPEVIEAHVVSVEELAEFADSAGHPVYWVGSQPGTELELSQDAHGQVFLRYLRSGAEVGSERAEALTIGTYELSDPTAALEEVAGNPGAIVRRSKSGSELISNASSPNSVYFASPDNSVQVEVYDDSPKRAMSLAVSGRVQPVG